jgi:hypothetical protein
MKLKTVLLATDGSDFSSGAEREGLALAEKCACGLLLLQVVELNPEVMALAPGLDEKLSGQAKAHLEALSRQAQEAGLQCQSLIVHSESPWRAIVQEAQRLGAGLIVLGRRGRTGLVRLLMGATAARVIGHSKVDVLVVPRAAKVGFDPVLAATDGSPYGDAAVERALQLAQDFGGRAVALSVALSQEELAQAEEALKGARARGAEGITLVSRRPWEAIVQEAQRLGAGLIVLGSHGRTGLQRALMGSVAERVVGLAQGAVLVVKP